MLQKLLRYEFRYALLFAMIWMVAYFPTLLLINGVGSTDQQVLRNYLLSFMIIWIHNFCHWVDYKVAINKLANVLSDSVVIVIIGY